MAKKKAEKPVVETQDVPTEELLSGVEIEVTPEVVAKVSPKKEKKFVGYHPVTGEEIWI